MLSTSKPSFADALRQADQALIDHGVPAAIERRLRNRLDERRRGSASRLAIGIAITATMAAAVLFLFVFRGENTPPLALATSGFTIENASQDLRYQESGSDGLILTQGTCEVVSAKFGIRITNTGKVAIQREHDGLRLVDGTASFSVKKRLHSQIPARILVSHGVIEVLGTEFTVHQREHGGDVLLHEGAIRFVAASGEVRTLAPGDSLSWPLPLATPAVPDAKIDPVSEPPVEDNPPISAKPLHATERIPRRDASDPEPETKLAAEPTVHNVFAELAKLRSRGQYEQAAKMLRSAIGDGRTTASAGEQFSYELGAILSDRLHDKDAACAHWKIHTRRYNRGKYATEVESAQLRLGCTEEKNEKYFYQLLYP